MQRLRVPIVSVLAIPGLLWAAVAGAQQPAPSQQEYVTPPHAAVPVVLPKTPDLDPKALAILKAASARLAAAHTLSFTATATYESPARTLQPLAYMTRSRVLVQRPDKLQVITEGDGPATEFYYNGKTMMALSPQDDYVAVAEAPPTIDAMLKYAYQTAAITFPFDDIISSDPYATLSPGLKLAFVVGQSRVVGNTVTDIVAIASEMAQAQIWIGAEDKLPRMIHVIYFNEPGNFRHVVEFSDWKLDAAPPAGSFTSARLATAKRIKFASPDAGLESSPPTAPNAAPKK